jgi:hypothetical protein
MYLKLQSAPLFSHLQKAFTPVLMIFTLSTLDVTMSLTSIDVKYNEFFFVTSLHRVKNIFASMP